MTRNAPSLDPRGFAAVAGDYAERLRVPLGLSETNIQGTVSDRIAWLRYMVEQTELLAERGVEIRRFCWYPLFDCAGWNTLLHGASWRRDPQGLYSCDRDWGRAATEFTAVYSRLAQGMPSSEIPSYAFTAMHDRTLAGLKKQMQASRA